MRRSVLRAAVIVTLLAAMTTPAVDARPTVALDGRTLAVDADVAFAAATVGYVVVYEHASYAGAARVLSADEPWLSNIGWNDRISSFKSFGASGWFYEHSPSGGFVWYYGPTSRVASLNGTYNDKFSSFYID